MVEVGDSNNEVILGLNRDINKEENGNNIVFKGMKNNFHSMQVQIVKMEGNDVLKLSDTDLEFLNRWLFKSEYKPLVSESGLVYYVIFKSMKGQFYSGGTILNIELESLPTAYTPIKVVSQTIFGTKTIEVTNITTVNESTPIDFYASMIEGNSFSISNLSTGKTFTINGLQNNEEFYVYGEQHFVESKIDAKRNLYKLSNKIFDLDLIYGKNKIKIVTDGKCEVQILSQSKMALQ